jgi:drug/metabolite transporter (DMT)-like permease
VRPSAPANAIHGIAFVALSMLVFAGMDASTKHLTMIYNVPLVVAVRYLGNLLLLSVIFGPREGRGLITTHRTGLVLLRALSLASASLFAGLALQRMPVAETAAIIFLAPFAVMLLAGPLLGERVGLPGWIAAGLGFLGVLMIVRPGSGLDALGVMFAVLTAALTVVYHLLSRVLAPTETTPAMMFFTAVAGSVLFGLTLPWTLHGPAPGALEWVLFSAIGGMALLGHFLFTAAYRHASASALAPVNYLHLGWATLLGWLIFDHLPDGWSLLGMALIACAGATSALDARKPAPV